MAHVKVVGHEGAAIRVIYLVDHAVGRGCPNRAEDVYLVQFFLNALWGKVPKYGSMTYGHVGAPAPPIDGICGHATVQAIERFQAWYWYQEPSRKNFIDGKVEVLPIGGSGFLPHHDKQLYTIIGLNVSFGLTFGTDRHLLLAKNPNFPSALSGRLFV